MSTYKRLLDLFADGGRHTEEELGRVTRYVQQWLCELRASGHVIVEDAGGYRLVGGGNGRAVPPSP